MSAKGFWSLMNWARSSDFGGEWGMSYIAWCYRYVQSFLLAYPSHSHPTLTHFPDVSIPWYITTFTTYYPYISLKNADQQGGLKSTPTTNSSKHQKTPMATIGCNDITTSKTHLHQGMPVASQPANDTWREHQSLPSTMPFVVLCWVAMPLRIPGFKVLPSGRLACV